MIILRYLTREILLTTMVISFCLFLLFFGNRFAQYLNQAVEGELEPAVIVVILAYRVPDIMVLILPVAYFLSILIAYGRLYSDNEMVVLSSCGVSQARLLLNTMVSAVVVASVVGVLSVFVVPHSVDKAEEIKAQQGKRSFVELLLPGRFEQFNRNQPTTYYFESFSNNGKSISKVFVADVDVDPERDGIVRLVTANSAREIVNSTNGHRYLLLNDGYQYVGKPGELDFQVTQFDSTGNLLRQAEEDVVFRKYYERQTTLFLMQRDDAMAVGEVQWRFSLPLLVIVLTLLAVPLSHTNPRRGRYAKIFPAFIPTFIYLGLLVVSKRYVQDSVVPASIGIWWVHGIFIIAAVLLLLWNNGRPLGKWKPHAVTRVAPETAAGGGN